MFLMFLQQYLSPQPTSRLRSIYNLVRRHLILPYLLPRRTLWGPLTRIQAILYFVYITGTIACNIIRATELHKARARAGSFALLHLCLLSVFPRFSFAAAFFGISLRSYYHIHKVMGSMAIFQSVLHTILAVQTTRFDLQATAQKYGLIVSVSLFITLYSGLTYLGNCRYWGIDSYCGSMHASLRI